MPLGCGAVTDMEGWAATTCGVISVLLCKPMERSGRGSVAPYFKSPRMGQPILDN